VKNATLILAFAHFARKEPHLVQTRRGFRLVTGDVARVFQPLLWPNRQDNFLCRFGASHLDGFSPWNGMGIQSGFLPFVLVQLQDSQMRAAAWPTD